ncbi:MAG TPA: hypothetical protein DCY95_00655, partial [Algoriphagus sp.]|nr:hypothetical protein [Algoriphagus sp.]
RNKGIGSEVLVQGVLTVSDQLGGPAFIQDATGGIPVFDSQVHGLGNYQIGDEIRILGSIGAFNQQIQIVNISELELISS